MRKKKASLIALIICVAVTVTMGAALSGCTVTPTATSAGSSAVSTTSSANKATSSKSAAPSKAAKNYITKEDYDKIQNDMSYADVKNIIGSDGKVLSETGTKGDALYTVMYDWYGKDGISNATFEFQGDKLQIKSQVGLQ